MHNLDELSDYDFERLVADLLSAEWGLDVQTFPRGRDGGVDLRVLGPTLAPLNLLPGQELIVQCKHRPKAGMAKLRPVLRAEAAKPVVTAASRYVLVTSAPITRANKKEIVEIFAGALLEVDIYGQNDVSALLRRHGAVERGHLKLWLNSGAVLQALVHQTEHLRSAAFVSDLRRLRRTFVETDALAAASASVDRHGICILSGPPGVGKTTTASMLLLRYMAEGWRPAVAVGRVRELEEQFEPTIKQILFFDDFLGQNSLEAKLDRGEDAELLRLIHTVSRDENKILILTTRDYVLQQARQSYEKLSDDLIDLAKIAVTPTAISPAQRAHILYNQLYYSPLRERAAAAVDGPRLYEQLTAHRNYNPRLIDIAVASAVRDLVPSRSSAAIVAEAPEVDIPTLLRRALDDPTRLWDHILRHQLTSLQLSMLLTRLSLGHDPVGIDLLFDATSRFAVVSGPRAARSDLTAALRVLDGDFFTTEMDRTGRMMANRLNPGAGDAVLAYLAQNRDRLAEMIRNAGTFEQVRWASRLLGQHRRSTPERSIAADLRQDVLAAAERTLMAAPVARSLRHLEGGWCFDLAARLDFFGQLLAQTGQPPTYNLSLQVIPAYVHAMKSKIIYGSRVVDVVAAIFGSAFDSWRPERTRLAAAAFAHLGKPRDLQDWETLLDLVDVVEPASDYLEDLQERFEDFAEEFVEEADAMLDDSPADVKAYRMQEELELLASLAVRCGVSVDVHDVLGRLEELDLPPAPRPDRNQLSLFPADARRPEKVEGASDIFRHL